MSEDGKPKIIDSDGNPIYGDENEQNNHQMEQIFPETNQAIPAELADEIVNSAKSQLERFTRYNQLTPLALAVTDNYDAVQDRIKMLLQTPFIDTSFLKELKKDLTRSKKYEDREPLSQIECLNEIFKSWAVLLRNNTLHFSTRETQTDKNKISRFVALFIGKLFNKSNYLSAGEKTAPADIEEDATNHSEQKLDVNYDNIESIINDLRQSLKNYNISYIGSVIRKYDYILQSIFASDKEIYDNSPSKDFLHNSSELRHYWKLIKNLYQILKLSQDSADKAYKYIQSARTTGPADNEFRQHITTEAMQEVKDNNGFFTRETADTLENEIKRLTKNVIRFLNDNKNELTELDFSNVIPEVITLNNITPETNQPNQGAFEDYPSSMQSLDMDLRNGILLHQSRHTSHKGYAKIASDSRYTPIIHHHKNVFDPEKWYETMSRTNKNDELN